MSAASSSSTSSRARGSSGSFPPGPSSSATTSADAIAATAASSSSSRSSSSFPSSSSSSSSSRNRLGVFARPAAVAGAIASLGLRAGAAMISIAPPPPQTTSASGRQPHQPGSGRAAAAAASLALQHTLAQQKRKRVADPNAAAAAAGDDAMDGDGGSFNSAANNIPSSSSLSALSVEQGRSALAQFVVQRIFFNPEPDPAAPGLGEPRLVRLVRMQMNSTLAPPSSSSSSLSSAATPASSSGAGAGAGGVGAQSVPVIESFVRASDLCMTVLNSKSSVHALIRDFNQPYEKTLLRLPGSGAGRAEVYCLTRKGVQRFALTKKVRAQPALERWVNQVLLMLMRPGNENIPVPLEAQPRGEHASSSSAASLADEAAANAPAGEDAAADRAALEASLRALPLPSASVLSSWVSSSLSLAGTLLRAEEDRLAQMALVAAALPSHAPGGSSAGKDWVGDKKFEGRQIRLGGRHQAVLPEKLTKKEQDSYTPPWANDVLVSSPSAVTVRVSPLFPWFPRLRPSDPTSRRHARREWEAEQLEARRNTRRNDAATSSSEQLAQAISAAAALGGGSLASGGIAPSVGDILSTLRSMPEVSIAASLAALDQRTRDIVETKLVFSAFSKLYREPLDFDTFDFEPPLLSLFIAPGRFRAVFTGGPTTTAAAGGGGGGGGGILQDPASIAEPFEVAATSFVPINKLLAAQSASLSRSSTSRNSSSSSSGDRGGGAVSPYSKRLRMDPAGSYAHLLPQHFSSSSAASSAAPSRSTTPAVAATAAAAASFASSATPPAAAAAAAPSSVPLRPFNPATFSPGAITELGLRSPAAVKPGAYAQNGGRSSFVHFNNVGGGGATFDVPSGGGMVAASAQPSMANAATGRIGQASAAASHPLYAASSISGPNSSNMALSNSAALLQPVKLPAASLLPPADPATLASRLRVQAQQQRPPPGSGSTHFPSAPASAASLRGGGAAAGVAGGVGAVNSAAASSSSPNAAAAAAGGYRFPAAAGAGGKRSNTLGLKSTATAAPPSLASPSPLLVPSAR